MKISQRIKLVLLLGVPALAAALFLQELQPTQVLADPPNQPSWRQPSSPVYPGATDMLWGVTSPPGDYMYVSGMREYIPVTDPPTQPPYVVVMKVLKATGIATAIYEYQTGFLGGSNINGGDIVYGTDGFLYVVGWEPHATLGSNGFVMKLDPVTMQQTGFGFKKFFGQIEQFTNAFYRVAFYDNKIWAAGFMGLSGGAQGNADWLVVSFDATTGDPINQEFGFTEGEGYPCDDEINDIYVNAAGVFVIGQVDIACQGTPRIPQSFTVKLNHSLVTLASDSSVGADGWSIAGIGGKVFTLGRDLTTSPYRWRYKVLTENLGYLQEAFGGPASGYNMPRSIDVRNLYNDNGGIIGAKIVTGGFSSCTGTCMPGGIYDWHLEGWQYINATQALSNPWKQTDFANNGRSDIAHHVIFNPNFENSFFVVGCTNAPNTVIWNDCFVSRYDTGDYDMAAQARDFLTGL